MRTDGVAIVPEAINAIRGLIAREHSQRYVAPFVREYKAKAKNAQEAHEAIRPTEPARLPKEVARHLPKDQAALYELIWKRAVASQMASAELEQTTADIEVRGRDGKLYMLRATGSVVVFEGFLKVYDEGRDDRVRALEKGKEDKADAEDDDSRRLPPLAEGERVRDKSVDAEQHFTQPPPRYSEATLVKKMEELGIGRPSTYAATLAVLQEREYVKIEKKRLIPEDKGRLVTAFLKGFFQRYVEYDFTADLEDKLDLISDDKLKWKDVLRDFWKQFMAAVDDTKELRVADVLEALNEQLGPHIFPDKGDGTDPRLCPTCGQGRLSLKTGKFGAFIGCSNYPECRFTRQFSDSSKEKDESAPPPEGRLLGEDPETGLPVTLRAGRFGTYLQLGDGSDDEKPKRASLPKGVDPAGVELDYALRLLRLPRVVGAHPETGNDILAGIGRYGPYVQHEKTYVNLPSVDEVFEVGVNRAVSLFADKAAGRGGRGRPAPTVLKALGEHPGEGGKIEVLSGRYGPYVKHGDINATLPRTLAPEAVTLEQAVQLIAERAARGPSKGKPKRGGGAKSKKSNGGDDE
jgi:DNA topoisomerase-1